MIRKIYTDFVKKKIRHGRVGWLLQKASQYCLIKMSFVTGRPLCGPVLGMIVTNYTCNYRCEMCDLHITDAKLKKKGLKELDTEGFERVLKDMASLGVAGVSFTGGEPLMRKDIARLVSYANGLGMFTHLSTNGYFLDKDMAGSLVNAGLDSVTISLDGALPATHDAIRGHDGAFEKAMSAIENAGAAGAARSGSGARLRIKLAMVLCEKNIDELADIVRLSRDRNADCVEIIPLQDLSASGRRQAGFSEDFMRRLDAALNEISRMRKEGYCIENSPRHLGLFRNSFKGERSSIACYASYSSLIVDCYGEVYPCLPWSCRGESFGNLNGKSLKEIWYSNESNGMRNKASACADCYLNCHAELNIIFNIGKRLTPGGRLI